jgi:Transposase DDE domain
VTAGTEAFSGAANKEADSKPFFDSFNRGIIPFLAKRNTEHGSGLGRWRWVVERTFAWLNQFRRLRVRYEKRADIHEAFMYLGCALICWNVLKTGGWFDKSGLAK